jgi:hypothetical protein
MQTPKMDDDDDEYLTALNSYFALKNEYESKYKEKIKNISKLKYSKKEKKKRIASIKRKCINCGNLGGTFFGITTVEDGTKEYTAMCMAQGSNDGEQCGLNIQLKKGKIINIIYEEERILKNIEQIKNKIISGKLNLLFGLEEEDIALNEFEDLKFDLEKFNAQLNLVQEKQFQNNSVQIVEQQGEPETILKEKYLKQLNKNLNRAINTYKTIISEANKDDYLQKKAKYNDAALIYVQDIKPIIEKIRSVKYDQSFVETDEMEIKLFDPITYTIKNIEHIIQNVEIIADEYAIVSNEK